MTASARSPPFISSTILRICAFPPPFSSFECTIYILTAVSPSRPRRLDRFCNIFFQKPFPLLSSLQTGQTRVAFFSMHGILIIIFYSAETEGVQHEQSNKNQPFVCAGRAGPHCACHAAPICQPAYFTRSDSQSSAKRDLCVFVQRVVLYPLAPHRAGAGAALSAGDIG